MTIYRFDSMEATARTLAARVADAVRDRPALVLGLPAGRTMIPVYEALRNMHQRGAIDPSRIRTFQVDEFVGLSSRRGSFREFLDQHLLTDFGIDEPRAQFLDGNADPVSECARYENAILSAGGVDLQLLGIGRNGHIGFNEPGPTLRARTHLVTLHEETRRSNVAWFDGELARVPREALSMGMETLLEARSVALIAAGEDKADAIRRAVEGPISTEVPASFLQSHRQVEVYLDRAAASGLR